MAAGGHTESLRLQACVDCSFEFPEDRTQCPHCGRPQLFPNVKLAERRDERDALEARFQAALRDADTRSCRRVVDGFYVASLATKAVICCPAAKLFPLASGSHDLYATFYDLEELRFSRSARPGQPDWNTARIKGEIDLLGGSSATKNIHYAALSIDQFGVANYGEYAVVLRDDMISHRASVFQENSGVYFLRNHGAAPKGFRSNWADRGKLCVAKLEDRLTSTSTSADFPKIILKAAPDPVDDEFLEVQVFGPMTVRTFERVTRLTGTRNAGEKAVHLAIRDYLAKAGMKVEKQP
jgi:hypothetical protein